MEVRQIQIVEKTVVIPQLKIVENTVVQNVDRELDTSEEAPVNAGIGQDPKMFQRDQSSESYENGSRERANAEHR